jgi:hypothetical protein
MLNHYREAALTFGRKVQSRELEHTNFLKGELRGHSHESKAITNRGSVTTKPITYK